MLCIRRYAKEEEKELNKEMQQTNEREKHSERQSINQKERSKHFPVFTTTEKN